MEKNIPSIQLIYMSKFMAIDISSLLLVKGNFGYCPRASFLRQETGKVSWVPSFNHFQIASIQVDISTFS